MGDSQGVMYENTMKKVASELDYRLHVIAAPAEEALPTFRPDSARLWEESLATVRKERPTLLSWRITGSKG